MTDPMPEFGKLTAMTASMNEIYNSFVESGFTADQALDLVKSMLNEMIRINQGKEDKTE